MRSLIRRITRKSSTGVTHADESVEADTLTIGRATDQKVFLPDLHVALRHAELRRLSDGRFSVQARTPSGVEINGRIAQVGTLRVGDRLTVGRTELRLLKPPAGADLLLQVDDAPLREGRQLSVGALSLRETRLSKRGWSWVLFLLLLGLGLGVPFAAIYQPRLPFAPPDLGGGPIELAEVWAALGAEQGWESGPISRPHRFFGQQCGECHRQPFQRVTDAACLECHQGQPHHGDERARLQRAGLDQWRCADCHLEHNGADGLIVAAPRLCTDCHARPAATVAGWDSAPVSGFSVDAHPQFRARVVAPVAGGAFEYRRLQVGPGVREDHGLVFPHAAHLAVEGVEGPDGIEQLECGSCHRPGADERAMQPIAFERDCQRCHRLDFEPNEPGRQLPHGRPEVVLERLQEYYARVALAGGYRNPQADPPALVQRRRPRGAELDRSERRAALEWAEGWAREIATELFEYRSCKTCHAIERRADGGWAVAPVALTQEWFRAHRFDHGAHEQMDCTGCHAAEQSSEAADVLMPGIRTCVDCHGGADSTARVPSDCVDCHGFHAADTLTMGPAARRAGRGED